MTSKSKYTEIGLFILSDWQINWAWSNTAVWGLSHYWVNVYLTLTNHLIVYTTYTLSINCTLVTT